MKGVFVLFAFVFLLLISGLYTFQRFNVAKTKEKITLWLINKKIIAEANKVQKPQSNEEQTAVLGKVDSSIPGSYSLSVLPRKQIFNLSCEFAAATVVIYHYTNDDFFSVKNQLEAEKTLIAKIPASMNPNIGVRMGESAIGNSNRVYSNLNQKFGGTDYYGVHAPPFIDLFWEYKLLARPIQKVDVEAIKKAIFSGHLVMAWIQVGHGKAVDASLSYGTTPVVKGEHAVVVYGYSKEGVYFMDPGIGKNRFMSFQTLLEATSAFPLPFLEVYPSVAKPDYDPTERVDMLTGLDRSVIKILIQNSNKEVGAGSAMAEILKDFGYKVQSVEQVNKDDQEGVSILLKKELSDYEKLLQQDISLAGYKISSFSATQALDNSADAVVLVGE